MVLVPLGISVAAWSRSIDPKSKSRSVAHDNFTDETGIHSFHKVRSSKKANHHNSSNKGLTHPKIVSPVQQILEQTKEKEKRADGPDTENITFNMAASSSTGTGGRKGKKKSASSSVRSDKKKSSSAGTIKRLQRKRKSQSTTTLRVSKKSRKK